nr:Streptogramin lyase [Streptococcus thermophilus]
MSSSRLRSAAAVSVSAAVGFSALVAPHALAQPAASLVVINEVESNGDPVADWVELANTNNGDDIDISGWKILDDNDKHDPIVIPDGTKIESGGYYALYTEKQTPDGSQGFGLGKKDSVRVFDAADKLVAETTWDGHAEHTWGRIPDKTGEFTGTGNPTRGTANEAAGEKKPVAETAWPFDPQEIQNIDLGGAFAGEDMSGIDFDNNGRAWIVNNDKGTLFAVDYDEETKKYTEAGNWKLRYKDGSGDPDAEGIAFGQDGALYVATERNNEHKDVSRPSVLRFELPTGDDKELKATHEWDLKGLVGEIGANSGWEAISYIPDQNAYALGLEANGKVYFVDLKDDETHELKQEYQSPFAGVMALDYNSVNKQLRVMCDEVCDGASLLLAHNGTEFAPVSKTQARPAKMNNFANEGFAAFVSRGQCEGKKLTETTRFLWADDGVSNGISLRGAVATKETECEPSTGLDTSKGSGEGSAKSSARDADGKLTPGATAGIALGVLAALGTIFVAFRDQINSALGQIFGIRQ